MVQDILLGFWLVVAHYLWVLVDDSLVAENHGWCELGVGSPCKYIVVVEDVVSDVRVCHVVVRHASD